MTKNILDFHALFLLFYINIVANVFVQDCLWCKNIYFCVLKMKKESGIILYFVCACVTFEWQCAMGYRENVCYVQPSG